MGKSFDFGDFPLEGMSNDQCRLTQEVSRRRRPIFGPHLPTEFRQTLIPKQNTTRFPDGNGPQELPIQKKIE
jgi:hypothetical protein